MNHDADLKVTLLNEDQLDDADLKVTLLNEDQLDDMVMKLLHFPMTSTGPAV